MPWRSFTSKGGSKVGLRSPDGQGEFSIRRTADDDATVETRWSLTEGEAMTCRTTVLTDHTGEGLGDFLTRAAADAKGWSGVRRWDALENAAITAVNSGQGWTRLTIALRQRPYADAWSVVQPIEVEAKKDMRRLAEAVAALLSA